MNERKRVRRDVEQFLRPLGEDAQDVTEHLRLLGVPGKPRGSRECANARSPGISGLCRPVVRP